MEATGRKLRRIVAGTDFSRPAARAVVRAAMLAAEQSARLEIVHVTQPLSRAGLRRFGLAGYLKPGPGPITTQHLDEARALAQAQRVAVTVRLMSGDAARTMASEAARVGADLVVVGCRGERSFKDALIGTTAERVIERWAGDTLVVRNTPRSPYTSILACVALGPQSCSVIASATALAADARLHVLHAYLPPFEKKLLSHHASSGAVAKHRAAAKREAAWKFAEMLRQCPMPPDRQPETMLRHGSPSDLIPRVAVRQGAEVIVVGKNQSALEDFLLGSVTKRVVRSAFLDVLVSGSR